MFLIIWILSLVGVAALGLGVYGWMLKMEEDGEDIRLNLDRLFKGKRKKPKNKFNY